MRKVLSLVLVLCMGACLVACGSSKSSSNYKEQKVTYKDKFEVTCTNDEVVCNKEYTHKPDVLVVTLKVKNIGKKDDSFASVANIIPKQGEELLTMADITDKNGKILSSNASDTIKKGKTATIKYGWNLENHKDDVIVNFDGYIIDADAGKMTFKVKGKQSKENAKYEEESKKEYESRQKMKDLDSAAFKITVPKEWTAIESTDDSIKIEANKEVEGVSPNIKVNSYDFGEKNVKKRAFDGAKAFKIKKGDVKTYKVNGKTFYGFEPVDDQFYLYGKASNGNNIEIDGMHISYKNAKKLLNKNITIK